MEFNHPRVSELAASTIAAQFSDLKSSELFELPIETLTSLVVRDDLFAQREELVYQAIQAYLAHRSDERLDSPLVSSPIH